jgi:hypothetical protein
VFSIILEEAEIAKYNNFSARIFIYAYAAWGHAVE